MVYLGARLHGQTGARLARLSTREGSMTVQWTPANIEKLRTLAYQGKSSREIAKLLGTTRNSILGSIHRHGVRMRPQKKSEAAFWWRDPTSHAHEGCKWPNGDPKDKSFHFCG